MSGMMLHGLGDCAPEFNCGFMDYEPTEAEVGAVAAVIRENKTYLSVEAMVRDLLRAAREARR